MYWLTCDKSGSIGVHNISFHDGERLNGAIEKNTNDSSTSYFHWSHRNTLIRTQVHAHFSQPNSILTKSIFIKISTSFVMVLFESELYYKIYLHYLIIADCMSLTPPVGSTPQYILQRSFDGFSYNWGAKFIALAATVNKEELQKGSRGGIPNTTRGSPCMQLCTYVCVCVRVCA